MDIIETEHEHGYTMKVTRSLDRTNCNDLHKALELLVEKWDGPVWLDIEELQSIDSAGLALLLKWHRRSLNENRRFGLVHTTAFHRKLLEITLLDEELMIFAEPGGPRIRILREGPWHKSASSMTESPR